MANSTLLPEAAAVEPPCLSLYQPTHRHYPDIAELADPEVDDTLDDLAELVLNAGGRVVVVPAARMPSTTGVAAIYRF